jgi:aromatase
MTELMIWTARHTVRVAAPPKRVFELIANVDRWPALLGRLVSVAHLGFDGACERVRFSQEVDGVPHELTMVRELNPKRLQVRFRQVDVRPPVASMGGFWLVTPKGLGSMVALDHYYRVVGNAPETAAGVEQEIAASARSMLAALRRTMELELTESCSDELLVEGDALP